MNDDDRRIRELFQHHLEGLHPTVSVEGVRRRARRGRVLIAISTATAVAAVAVAAVVVAGTLEPERRDSVIRPGPSPRAGLIAFTTQGGGDMTSWIAVVPADGGEVTRLHEGKEPSWSPDGTRIAFGCDRGICTMNADGSDVRQLTDPMEPAFDEDPDWGPNGSIAYTRNYSDGRRGRDIFVVREDGSEPRRLTNDSSDDSQPSWSPDGSRLAVIRGMGSSLNAPPGGYQLWTISVRDAASLQLTDDRDHAARPDWSPNGETILFDRGSALWTIPAGGGEPRKLPVVSGRGFDVGSFAAWAPDSRRFAFMCSSTGRDNNDICVSDVGSEEWTVLVATGANEASPAWQSTEAAPDTADSSPQPSPSPATQDPPDCGKTNIASDDYGTEIQPTSGPPGTEVRFSGTTLRGEDWRWAPSDRIEAWWNTDAPGIPGGAPLKAGPVVRLVRVDDMERCRFETTFTVPDADPGRYKISVFSWFENPRDGYGLFLPHYFTVTAQ